MKKIGLVLLTMILAAGSLFAEDVKPEKRNADSMIIDSVVNKKRPEDNFRIINSSSLAAFDLSIYAFNGKQWFFAGKTRVRKQGETYSIDNKLGADLSDFRYYSLESEEIKDYTVELSISHSDLYITIKGGTSTGKEVANPDYTKYQMVVQKPGLSKSQIFEGLLQACIDIYQENVYGFDEIDRDSGVIKNKASWSDGNIITGDIVYKYSYTIEAKENRFRITFDHFSKDGYFSFDDKLDADSYEKLTSEFDAVISKLTNELDKQSSSSDDDW